MSKIIYHTIDESSNECREWSVKDNNWNCPWQRLKISRITLNDVSKEWIIAQNIDFLCISIGRYYDTRLMHQRGGKKEKCYQYMYGDDYCSTIVEKILVELKISTMLMIWFKIKLIYCRCEFSSWIFICSWHVDLFRRQTCIDSILELFTSREL